MATAAEIEREVACRRADLYATRQFQHQTAEKLAALLSEEPAHPDVQRFAAQLSEGQVMDHYRRQQAALMPAKPSHPAAEASFRELGDARFEMAHARVRMDLASQNRVEWEEWRGRHLDAAQRASLAAARMTVIEESGTGDRWSQLSADQQRAVLETVSADGSFDTPLVPRRYKDLVDDIQDEYEGISPIREDIDHTGVAPHGAAEPRLRRPDADETAKAPKGAARGAQMKQQQKRRRSRARGARKQWSEIRSGARQFKRIERKVDEAVDELIPMDTAGMGGSIDPTFLSTLLEQASGRRR